MTVDHAALPTLFDRDARRTGGQAAAELAAAGTARFPVEVEPTDSRGEPRAHVTVDWHLRREQAIHPIG